MRARGWVAVVTVAVMCSLGVVLGSGAAAGDRSSTVNRPCLHLLYEVLNRPVRLLHTAPPAALTSILEVLRRPALSTDRLPPGGPARIGYSVLWIDYVRLLGAGPEGIRYFLVPGIDTWRHLGSCLRTLPLSTRRRLQTEAREQSIGSVTLEAFNAEEELGAIPYTAPAIEAGRALMIVPSSTSSTALVSGIVPDGIASVTITASNSAPVTVAVTGNFFLSQIPTPGQRPLLVEWHAASGSILKTVRIDSASVNVRPSSGGPTMISISPPSSVTQAGGSQLAEFELGRSVSAQSGCLACHRIGDAGNAGPGRDLTHIGSMLSPAQIEHAIVDPSAPMPSFSKLPAAKFKALVEFLSLLR
jgi:hypothetical protein